MTLNDIKNFVVSVDQNAGHYESAYRDTDAYTVWFEVTTLDINGDNVNVGALRFQIDRFTKAEDDSIAAALDAALEARYDISYTHLTSYETDTGYIHHIFDCEGV